VDTWEAARSNDQSTKENDVLPSVAAAVLKAPYPKANQIQKLGSSVHSAIGFSGCIFANKVDLRPLFSSKAVVFWNCDFTEQVIGDGGDFHSPIKFIGCRFQKSLHLQEAVFHKGLTVSFCLLEMEDPNGATTRAQDNDELKLEGAVPAPPEPELNQAPSRVRSAWWAGLRVTGLLRLDRTFFGGSVNLAEARIDGPILMRGISVGCQPRNENKTVGRLHMRNIQVNGDIELTPHTKLRCVTTSKRSVVNGSLVLAGCKIRGRVDLRGVKIAETLHMPHAHVRDRLEANAWQHEGDADFSHVQLTEIGHKKGISVRLADAEIGHSVWFDGAELGGQFNAKNATIGGDFYLRQAYDSHNHLPIANGSTVRFASDAPASMDEAVRLSGAKISGCVDLTWARLEGKLDAEGAIIGSDLVMRGTEIAQRSEEQTIARTLFLQSAKIGGAIELRGARIHGEISARETSVGGDVTLAPWHYNSFREGRWKINPDDIGKAKEPAAGGGAQASSTKFQGIYVRGDVNFSGSRIEGVFEFELPEPADRRRRQAAEGMPRGVSGSLLLKHTHMQEMSLAVCNHDECPDLSPRSIDISHAVTGALKLKGHLTAEQPPCFEMRGMQFDELVLGEFGTPEDHAPAKAQLTFAESLRRRFYYWAWPTPALLIFAFLTLVIWPICNQTLSSPWPYLAFLGFVEIRWIVKHRKLLASWLHSSLVIIGIVSAIIAFCVLWPLPDRQFVWDDDAGVFIACHLIAWLARWVVTCKKRDRKWWGWYPQQEALFLRLMRSPDAGLYARVEGWLRNRGRIEDADRVYLERRLSELEHGLTKMAGDLGCTFWHWITARLLKFIGSWLLAKSSGCRWKWGWIEPMRKTIGDQMKNGEKKARAYFLTAATPEGRRAYHLEVSEHDKPCGWGDCWSEMVARVVRFPRRLYDRLMLLFAGDGVRIGPLLFLWLAFFLFSWRMVFSHADSVERPATFVAARDYDLVDSHMPSGDFRERLWSSMPLWKESMGDARLEHWGRNDSFWMAANCHLPLVDLIAREKWRPSSHKVEPLKRLAAGLRDSEYGSQLLDSWPVRFLEVPRYDTWAAMAQLSGWVAVPIILGSLTGLLRRRAAAIETE